MPTGPNGEKRPMLARARVFVQGAICADSAPVAPNASPRFVECDLAGADGARQAAFDFVLLGRFVPKLKL